MSLGPPLLPLRTARTRRLVLARLVKAQAAMVAVQVQEEDQERIARLRIKCEWSRCACIMNSSTSPMRIQRPLPPPLRPRRLPDTQARVLAVRMLVAPVLVQHLAPNSNNTRHLNRITSKHIRRLWPHALHLVVRLLLHLNNGITSSSFRLL